MSGYELDTAVGSQRPLLEVAGEAIDAVASRRSVLARDLLGTLDAQDVLTLERVARQFLALVRNEARLRRQMEGGN